MAASKDIARLYRLIGAIVILAALYFARVIFVPLALGMLLAFALTPLARLLERIRFGRVFATVVVVALMLAAVGAVGWMVADQFAGVLKELPQYRSNIEEKISSLHFSSSTLENVSSTFDQITKSLTIPSVTGTVSTGTTRSSNRSSKPSRPPMPVEVITPTRWPIESVGSVLGWILQGVIVFVFTIFILLRRENLRNRFISLFTQRQLSTMTRALNEAGERVSRYLRSLLAVNAAYGALVGIGLHFIGIPGALLWGVLVGILRFLPYIGPPMGAVMPLLLSVAISHGWRGPLVTLCLFVTIELIAAYVIEPMLCGTYTGVSPPAILVAAIFWAFLWGPVGLLLSTPLTVCLVVLGRHIPPLGFLPLLLGDEAVLTPDAHVYQRVLALDQQEAEEVLESLLRERSLTEVYDTVLIPVLNLAEEDHHQEQLDRDSENLVCHSIREMIDHLFEKYKTRSYNGSGNGAAPRVKAHARTDIARSKSQHALTVACIPARDEADEIAGLMLRQLLELAGHRARCIPLAKQEEMIQALPEGADVVCISAISPFAMSRTRSIYAALQASLPGVPIVVGLWNFPGDLTQASRRIGMPKEKMLVTTLAGAVAEISDVHVAAEHR